MSETGPSGVGKAGVPVTGTSLTSDPAGEPKAKDLDNAAVSSKLTADEYAGSGAGMDLTPAVKSGVTLPSGGSGPHAGSSPSVTGATGTTATASENPNAPLANDGLTLQRMINRLLDTVPASGVHEITAEEFVNAVASSVEARKSLLSSYDHGKVKADGTFKVLLKNTVTIESKNKMFVGPKIVGELTEGRLDIAEGFSVKWGFFKISITGFRLGEKAGEGAGIEVVTSVKTAFLPFNEKSEAPAEPADASGMDEDDW